jgi:hypothetical protein
MSSIPVYTGRWQDYSRGQILGDTLTLEVKSGRYLITALATFVGLVGSALWSLVAFAVHQLRAKKGSHDAVFTQHQVVYRTSNSPLHAIWDVLRICFAWRRRKDAESRVRQLKTRSILTAFPPTLVFAGFTVAALFVADVAVPDYGSSNVKVLQSQCGYVNFNTTTVEGQWAAEIKSVNDTLNARAYAKNCYDLIAPFAICSLYPVDQLPYTSSLVACPFGNDPSGELLCVKGGNSTLQLDTGLLDTSNYLGINVAESNRLFVRKLLSCTPIRVDSYEVVLNNDVGEPIYQYNMGYTDGEGDNFTYIYDSRVSLDNVPYQVT